MSNVIVMGAQWGDEGKGRLVDWLAQQVDIVARYNGGHNAGHTLVVGGTTYKLALLPSGVVRGKLGVIGNGVVVDPHALLAEIARMQALGVAVTPANLLIAETASVLLPLHVALDAAQEDLRRTPLGTTRRGIGPAYEDKVGRRGVRICDLAQPELLSRKLDALLEYHNAWFRGLGLPLFAKQPMLQALLAVAPQVLAFAGPAWARLDQAEARGERILFEGAQAAMLDLDWGSYPFVTSSGTTAAHAASGTGISVTKLGTVLGVSKVYATRVGDGPFPTEMHGADAARLRELGGEFGVNTGRPRRCGWLDAAQLRQSIRVSGIAALALTKLDVLDTFETIRICTGYEVDGRRLEYLPPCLPEGCVVTPLYEALPGWLEPTRGARTLAALPQQARRLIARVSELTGTPVAVVTTGPERDDTIVLAPLWA